MDPLQEQEQSNQIQSTSSCNTVTGLFSVIVVVCFFFVMTCGYQRVINAFAVQDNRV